MIQSANFDIETMRRWIKLLGQRVVVKVYSDDPEHKPANNHNVVGYPSGVVTCVRFLN